MKFLLFIFLSVLIIEPTFAQSLSNPAIGRSANLGLLATRQYLSGKSEESLALYQKAIAKADSEFGKNSRVASDLYYQLGMRAFWLSKFDLAERSLKKAVEINPNSEAAQLMFINLLRFRNRDVEAYGHIQQALKKLPASEPLRKDLVISLQEREPLRATQQAYLVNCVQNGITEKVPALKYEHPAEPKKLEIKGISEKSPKNQEAEKSAVKKVPTKSDNQANKKAAANQISQPTAKPQAIIPQAANKAIYEPIKNTINVAKVVKPNPKKTSSPHKKSNKLPAGLVPPPPPDTLGLPLSVRGGMRAKAGSIKLEKALPIQSTAEPQKSAVEHPPADSDPDFLIEWASVKKKHQSTK